MWGIFFVKAITEMFYTKAHNGYSILCFQNPYRVRFLIHGSAATLLLIGIIREASMKAIFTFSVIYSNVSFA
jgi:hypothetical protein